MWRTWPILLPRTPVHGSAWHLWSSDEAKAFCCPVESHNKPDNQGYIPEWVTNQTISSWVSWVSYDALRWWKTVEKIVSSFWNSCLWFGISYTFTWLPIQAWILNLSWDIYLAPGCFHVLGLQYHSVFLTEFEHQCILCFRDLHGVWAKFVC